MGALCRVAGCATAAPYPAEMRYQTKHEWAAAKAAELRKQALNTTWAISRSRQRANANHYAYYDREALRYERMAERFKARGV